MATFLTLLVAAGGAVVYVRDVRRHPWLPCRRCDGSGKSRSDLRESAFGPCPRCKGTGRRNRLVARVLHRESS